uniref:Uncharacterized protein n=1 Tax=Lygus hesperus TaxID=30085 RepID=A0A0A9Z9P8_LYGHE
MSSALATIPEELIRRSKRTSLKTARSAPKRTSTVKKKPIKRSKRTSLKKATKAFATRSATNRISTVNMDMQRGTTTLKKDDEDILTARCGKRRASTPRRSRKRKCGSRSRRSGRRSSRRKSRGCKSRSKRRSSRSRKSRGCKGRSKRRSSRSRGTQTKCRRKRARRCSEGDESP